MPTYQANLAAAQFKNTMHVPLQPELDAMHVPLQPELDAMRFMATSDAWPHSNKLGKVQMCELAIIDATGQPLFDSLIQPTLTSSRAEPLSHHMIPGEQIDKAPTLATRYDEIVALLENRTVYVFKARWASRVLRQSRYKLGLPDFSFNLGDVVSLFQAYWESVNLQPRLGKHPKLYDAGFACGQDPDAIQVSFPDPNKPHQPRVHWALFDAEMCRLIFLHLLACAQANDEGQQGANHER